MLAFCFTSKVIQTFYLQHLFLNVFYNCSQVCDSKRGRAASGNGFNSKKAGYSEETDEADDQKVYL